MTSRLKKIGYTTIIGLGLFAGAAGIAAAASGNGSLPTPSTVVTTTDAEIPDAAEANDPTDAPDTPEANDVADATETSDANDPADSVNCEDGIDSVTGAQCDGGPSANQNNDPNEPAGVEDPNN